MYICIYTYIYKIYTHILDILYSVFICLSFSSMITSYRMSIPRDLFSTKAAEALGLWDGGLLGLSGVTWSCRDVLMSMVCYIYIYMYRSIVDRLLQSYIYMCVYVYVYVYIIIYTYT